MTGLAGARRVAVLDLGSTTFQLLVADATDAGALTPVLRDRVVLNLGLASAPTGEIPSDVARHAVETARRLHDVAVRSGADEIVTLATSALRDSGNRADLEALFAEAIDGSVRFIDGTEEARLTFAGVRASVALEPGPSLLLDLGGGSLEVALADEAGLRWGRSLPVGAGRLTGMLVHTDPPTRAERRAVRAAVEEQVATIAGLVEPGDAGRSVASGGTAGALARLLAARRWTRPPASLNQYEMSVGDLKALTEELAEVALEQRLRFPGIDERRAELLPTGGWVLTTAAQVLGIDTFIHSEWGLREGAVLDAVGLADDASALPAALRAASVDRLVRAWGEDPRHVALVARIAGELFEGLRALHGLGPSDRELLAHAAMLHEVGNAISPARYHKHGAYLVEHAGLRGFTPEDVATIASLVRFQRGKDPRPVYPPFADLPPERRDAVATLTGILRVAHAIGRGDERDTLSVAVAVEPARVRIHVTGSTDAGAATSEALEVAALLTERLEREVEVDAGG